MIEREELITEEGKAELEKELDNLVSVLKPANIKAIAEARAQGDLSENADYQSAKEEESRIDARIKEINNILKHAKIIVKDNSKLVSTGKTVSFKYLATEKELTVELVGTIEADPFKNKVSIDSPVGKGLIGHKKGDKVIITTEAGKEFQVQILEVK